MSYLSRVPALLLLGCLSCASPEDEREEPTAPAPAATDVDEATAVRTVAESWDPAMNAEDIDAIMALHADDVVRLVAGGPAIVGADAVRENFAAGFERTDSVQSNPVSEVQVAGDWAFARGTYEDQSEGATESGKWVSIFEKTAGGWKYTVDIWNRDAPATESASTPEPGGPSPELAEASVPEDLKSVLDSWDAALVAGDVDALVAAYLPESRRMNADQPTVTGLEAIRANFEEELATPPDASKGTVHGGKTTGDWAYVWGTWVETRGGEEDSGKWLEVLKRTPDGWKIYLDIWNRGV